MFKKKLVKIAVKIILAFLIINIIFILLIPEARDYIYGYFLFRRIGSNLTINIKDDFDKATMVAFWVFDNIKGIERYPYMPAIDDNFLNIYRRGFGYCDQSAHVYATMMHWLGFETKLLMLRREDGSSPHTVAVVKVKGKFMPVDASYKFIFADDKKNPVGVGELENSEVFNKYLEIVNTRRAAIKVEPLKIKPSWFKNGIYFETFPYADKKYLLRKVIQKIYRK